MYGLKISETEFPKITDYQSISVYEHFAIIGIIRFITFKY